MDALEIGRAIRVARKRLKITQADAGELAGISERTLRDIEKGKDGVALAAYINLLDVVGLSLAVTSGGADGR